MQICDGQGIWDRGERQEHVLADELLILTKALALSIFCSNFATSQLTPLSPTRYRRTDSRVRTDMAAAGLLRGTITSLAVQLTICFLSEIPTNCARDSSGATHDWRLRAAARRTIEAWFSDPDVSDYSWRH